MLHRSVEWQVNWCLIGGGVFQHAVAKTFMISGFVMTNPISHNTRKLMADVWVDYNNYLHKRQWSSFSLSQMLVHAGQWTSALYRFWGLQCVDVRLPLHTLGSIRKVLQIKILLNNYCFPITLRDISITVCFMWPSHCSGFHHSNVYELLHNESSSV